MASYKDLLAKREELEKQIVEARKIEITSAVEKIQKLIHDFDLTAEDIFPSRRGSKKTEGAKVAPKYRNPTTGETWTGRGKPPAWIRDKQRDLFKI